MSRRPVYCLLLVFLKKTVVRPDRVGDKLSGPSFYSRSRGRAGGDHLPAGGAVAATRLQGESTIVAMPRNDKEDNPVGGFKDLQGDRGNVLLLLLLYTLQGVPMGFAAAVPLILKERRASFNDIALFSVASLPFSAKLFC